MCMGHKRLTLIMEEAKTMATRKKTTRKPPARKKTRTKRGITSSGKSQIEESLALQLKAVGEPFVREHRFHPVRRWRFDFCFPDDMVAVEVMGGGRNGRHLRYTGYREDCVKMGEATSLGWTLLYVVGEQIKSGEALDWIQRTLKARRGKMPPETSNNG